MADLLSIMNNAATGLAAHQAAIATAAHNLQNVNTPGYARQRAELQAVSPAEYNGRAFIGRGVALQTVSQARDPFIERQLPAATAGQARATAESDALSSITALDPDGAGSLTAALGAFYDSLRGLSQNAGDPGLRQQVLGASAGLARAFNGATASLEAARTGLDQRLAGTVADVNQAAQTVARLNNEIASARASGSEPNDLLDARQTAANQLASLTGATQVPTGSGGLQIMLPGGGALVSDDRAATLAVAPDPANGGHLGLTLARADGSPPAKIPNAALGGALGGAIDARDGALLTAQHGLDQLASDVTAAVNTVHAAGVGTDGVSGRNLFVPQASAAGAAARMAVDPLVAADVARIGAASSAPGVPGDASNLLALVATETTPLTGGKDAGTTLSSIVTGFGAAVTRAGAVAAQHTTILTSLENARSSVSGVSIDEEMISLTKSQRAYEAVAKVIKTADDMLQTLLSIGG